MAQATRAGLAAARPQERPFLISRSGCTGIGRETALWTGDNFSNYHHLRTAIPTSLNLALSGVPFNGPDVGGFAGNTSPQLIRDWMKACCLFPFCRNHSCTGTRDQEPWAFDARTRDVLRHYIQLRYKLRPYLYQLFIAQAETGEAILRPLFHDFADTAEWPLGKIEDQFMVGPAVLQAPIVQEHQRRREVLLPGSTWWWSALEARWIKAPRRIKVHPTFMQTPAVSPAGAHHPRRTRGGTRSPAPRPGHGANDLCMGRWRHHRLSSGRAQRGGHHGNRPGPHPAS
jgi:alpha-glucosidase